MADRLTGVHPALVTAVEKIVFAMTYLGHQMMVTDGVRTLAQQKALFAQGRTAPGKIVTNADGINAKSNHQVKADGFGHAVDMCFVVNGIPSWGTQHPWRLYGEMAKSQGLKWGGDWVRLTDMPHIELPL
jgi:peptidoglycan L-alanyl-D-glutamate endopeptidase CwlK